MDTLNAFLDTHLCRYMNASEAQALLDVGEIRIVPRDEAIFNEGDDAGKMYAILMGFMKVMKKNPPGEDEVLAILSAGDIIGEMSVFDIDPRSATALTASEVTLYEIDRKTMLAFMKQSPGTAVKMLWAILETVSMRLRSSNDSYQHLLANHIEIKKQGREELE